MDVRRTPSVRVVPPRIDPRLDGHEPVAPLFVGEAAPAAGKVRIERSIRRVHVVAVTAGGVRLPNLDQLAPQWLPIRTENATRHHDPLPKRLAGVLTGQIGVVRPNG